MSAPSEKLSIINYHLYHRFLYWLSPVIFQKHRYKKKVGKRLNLENPKTFDEKLLWIMLYWRHPLKVKCADKYEMRSYVESQGYGSLVLELIGVYEKSSEIDFNTLPDRFVLKCNHGCRFNIFCLDKKELDVEKTSRQLDLWMKQDYSVVCGEIHYADIKPRIICERFLGDDYGTLPTDYLMHCFQGKVHFTTVCTGRNTEGNGAVTDYYDRDWRTQMALSRKGVHPERWMPPPDCYQEMLEAAEALSKPFPYVRIDFFCFHGKALLGEFTFTPSASINTRYTDEAQKQLGDLINLPEPLRR